LGSGVSGTPQSIGEEPPFHYIIVDTDVMNLDRPDLARQSVTVLMDEAAFSEENLKVLFRLLSKRFRDPDWMIVFVYTHVSQLDTQEQVPKPSDSKSKPMDCTHHSGFMSRHSGNEFLRYNREPGNCEWKTVMLRGDPKAA